MSAKEGASRIARTAEPLKLATLGTDTATLASKRSECTLSLSLFGMRIHVVNIENACCAAARARKMSDRLEPLKDNISQSKPR